MARMNRFVVVVSDPAERVNGCRHRHRNRDRDTRAAEGIDYDYDNEEDRKREQTDGGVDPSASALACAYAVDEYIGYFTERLDTVDDYWETNRARLWLRHGSKNSVDFAFRDRDLGEIITLLNKQLGSDVLIVLHASPEVADELRLSFTPNGDSAVPLRTALEVLRTRIEDTTTMQARWIASGNVIDFYCVEGDSPSAAESEDGAQGVTPEDAKARR